MDVLSNNKDEDLAIFRAHMKRTLQDHAEKMNDAQVKGMAGFQSEFWNNRSITTNEQSLFYRHIAVHRFIDMKTRVVGDKKKKKKHYEIHNRIIMGHYNGIQLDLTYGLTEQVRNDLKAQFDGKII